jgi:hypothetical protein
MHRGLLQWTTGLVVVCALPACDPLTEDEPVKSPQEASTFEALLGTLESRTPSGVAVSLAVDPDPPRPGAVRVLVGFPGGPVSADSPSVDLVAPHMPAHGIVRVPLSLNHEGHGEANIRIPMEGLWALYVNLNRGSEAAPFEFLVEADEDRPTHVGDETGGHHHHVSHRSSTPGHAPEGAAASGHDHHH